MKREKKRLEDKKKRKEINDLKSGKYDIVILFISFLILFIINRSKTRPKSRNGLEKPDRPWPKCLLICSMKSLGIKNKLAITFLFC